MKKEQILDFAKSVAVVVVGVLLADVAKQQIVKLKISKPLELKPEE